MFDKKFKLTKRIGAMALVREASTLRNPKLTTFLIDGSVHKELSKRAAARGTSMGRAIREAVDMWLKQKQIPSRKGGVK